MPGVVLGATQTSLDFSGRTAQHRSAAEAYGKLQRQVFEWFVTGAVAELSNAEIHSFLESVNTADSGSPALSKKHFEQAHKDAEQEERDHPRF